MRWSGNYLPDALMAQTSADRKRSFKNVRQKPNNRKRRDVKRGSQRRLLASQQNRPSKATDAEGALYAPRSGAEQPKGTVVWCHKGIMRVFCEGGFFTTTFPNPDG